MIATQENAELVLGQKKIKTITTCIELGFKRFFKLPQKARLDISPRSRASIINDFIRAEATKKFINSEDIRLRWFRGLFLVDFGKLQVRFKKLSKQLRPQNILTQQTLKFMHQEALTGQMVLPGIELPTKVVAGYLPDALFSSIQYMGILCFHGTTNEYLWKIDLAKTFKLPIPLKKAIPQEQPIAKDRVTPKEGITHGRKRAI